MSNEIPDVINGTGYYTPMDLSVSLPINDSSEKIPMPNIQPAPLPQYYQVPASTLANLFEQVELSYEKFQELLATNTSLSPELIMLITEMHLPVARALGTAEVLKDNMKPVYLPEIR